MRMKTHQHFVVLLPILIITCPISLVWGHCGNQEPRGDARGFRFEDENSPDYDTEHQIDYDFTAFLTFPNEVRPFQDTDSFAIDRQECTNDAANGIDPSPFYAEDTWTITNGTVYSCADAINCKKNPTNDGCPTVIAEIEAQLPAENFIPSSAGDGSDCCGGNSYRYKLDEALGPVEIEVAPEFYVNVKLTLTGNNGIYSDASKAQRFADLCEELFVCSQYLQFDDRRQCIARSNTDRYCPAYTERSLCFEDMYVTSDQDEQDYRTLFIVRACLGFTASFVPDSAENDDILENPLGGNDAIEILEDLVGSVETMCNEATARSREILFTASQVCKDLINCENVSFQFTGTPAERDPDDNSQAFNRCGSYTETVLQQQLDSCNNLGTGVPPLSNYAFEPMCPAYLQEHFNPFSPDYPNKNENDPQYFAIILEGGASASSGDSRTNASVVGSLKVALVAAKAVLIAAEFFKDAFPKEFYYLWRMAFWVIAQPAVEIIDNFIKLNDFHDANVDGAEIEAIYENSRQMLDGSAAVFDAVRCRISPIGTEGPKWGHGCDSVDNNCDRFVDECNEDEVLPIVDTSAAASRCSSQWFNSVADAKACVDSSVVAYDDCDPNVTVTSTLVAGSDCNDTRFDVVATTSRCAQINGATVTTKVAKVPPQVECSLKNEVDLVLLYSGSNKFEDIGLSYTVDNDTVGGGCVNEKNVTVTVLSNELEDFQSQKMAALYRYGDPLQRPGLFVAKGRCSTANNGQCIMDPSLTANQYARIYTIVVTAVDSAGNVGSDTCRAIILSTTLYNKYVNGQLNPSTAIADISTQRFILDEYTHSFVV